MKEIVQIVTTLPPAISGVGDYAVVLAQELRRLELDTVFVNSRSIPATADGNTTLDGSRVLSLDARTSRDLEEALEHTGLDTVLLHFSGYGYARWGLCFWLIAGLERWKKAAPGRRLITMFHELYAKGPPWNLGFWTFPPQYRIARQLAAASHGIVCGYTLIERRLKRWRRDIPVWCMPVFSNVGELDQPPPLADREPLAVIFGGAGKRGELYRALAQQGDFLAHLPISTILDIGPPINLPRSVCDRPIEPLGILSADQISSVMTRARVGLANYPLHVVAKSGILAAYHAHGLLCVNVSRDHTLVDDVQDGIHFVGHDSLARGNFDAAAIAAAGHRWYAGHNRRNTARLFARLLSEGGNGG